MYNPLLLSLCSRVVFFSKRIQTFPGKSKLLFPYSISCLYPTIPCVFFFRRLKIFYSWIIFITLDVSFLIYYHSRIIPSRQLGISSPSVFSSSCTLHSVFVLASPESSLFPSLSVLSNHLFVSFLVGSLLLLFYDTCLYAENFFLIVFNVLSRTIYMDFSLCSHHDFTVLSFIYLMKCKFFITCILQSPSLTTSAVPLYFPHRQFYVVRNLV